MAEKLTFFVVDDDKSELEFMVNALEEAGHVVFSSLSSVSAAAEIFTRKPDCIITDLMMPNIDGLELCMKIRENPDFADVRIVVISGKHYEFDELRARELGANGYIKKPLKKESFLAKVTEIMEDKIDLRYWGVRGTIPVSGEQVNRYGGATVCVTLGFANEQFFIFDAGSGIRDLGAWILGNRRRLSAKLFISHPHWDHINALPFFAPLYIQGNEFEICGPAQANLSMRDLISAQMEGVYFPITIREFASNVFFRDLREETFDISGITVRTRLLSHPGYCLGYRVDYNGRSICYVTDNELFLPDSDAYNAYYVECLTDFVRDSDVLITDTTYTDAVYKTKVGWGHSCVSQVVDLAHNAEVKELHLFHHDPSESDDDIDAKLKAAQDGLTARDSKTRVLAPAQGDQFIL